MTVKSFGARLKAALRDGNLRVADLARWFDVPYPTVREWMVNGRSPSSAPQDRDHIYEMLEILEHRIRKKQGFPLPRLSPSDRIRRLHELRSA